MSCCADAPWMDPFCRLAAKPVGTKRGVNNNNNKKGIREKESLYLPSAGVMLSLSLALKETHKEKRGTSGGLCVFFQPPCVPRVSSTLVHIRLSISLSLCVVSGRNKKWQTDRRCYLHTDYRVLLPIWSGKQMRTK